MATSSRDARRQRIMDKGSDRLALITGRLQAMPCPSSSLPQESNHSYTASCPPSISEDHDLSHKPIVPHDGEDESSRSLVLQHQSAGESGEINATDGLDGSQPVLHECETISEVLRAPLKVDDRDRVQPSRGLSTVQDSWVPPSEAEYQLQRVHRGKLITPNQISSAIAATESTRLYCSIAVAVLVALSYVGFPILGSDITKSILFFRPLFLVLLTNISLVLGRLLLGGKQRGFEKTEQEADNVSSVGDELISCGKAELLGKALESGLLLQNIMGALFIDCSVYSIVVVCGLSIAQKLGW